MTGLKPMTWWKTLEPIYKALGALLGAIALGMAVMTYTIGGKASSNTAAVEIISEENSADHLQINSRIYRLETGVDTIKGDLALVRCWVLHEIQGTDSRECLVIGRGGTS